MKPKFLILALLLYSHLIFGQDLINAISIEDKEFNAYFLNKGKMPVIKGIILNLSPEEVRLTKIKYSIVTPFAELQVTKNSELNADGTFELKLDYPFPYQQVWINFGELFFTGIYATTDLYIELDARLLKEQKDAAFNCAGVKYLGDDGALNAYKNNHVLFKRDKQLELDVLTYGMRYHDLDYYAYIKKYDSLYAILTSLDNEFIKQNPSDFSWLVMNERQSEYYGNLCVAHWNKQMPIDLFERVKKHKAYLISNAGMLFYKYLFSYLVILPSPKKTNNIAERTLRTINTFDSLFSRSKSDLLKLKFSSKDPNEQKTISETVLANLKTDWCKIVVQEEYDKTLKKLAIINKTLAASRSLTSYNLLGQPIAELPFGAKLYKVDSLDGKSLLSNLKNSFQNKALLIDLWATWCGPCIKEFPHSKKLHENTRDLPVEFVYLCTSEGSDLEKWKTKIAEFELSGTHIYVDKKIVNGLLEILSGSGFPTYALINTKGEYKPGPIRPSGLDKNKLSELIK